MDKEKKETDLIDRNSLLEALDNMDRIIDVLDIAGFKNVVRSEPRIEPKERLVAVGTINIDKEKMREVVKELIIEKDLAPVIRCKDCKHFRRPPEYHLDDWGICEEITTFCEDDKWVSPEDYCSYAKRSEE